MLSNFLVSVLNSCTSSFPVTTSFSSMRSSFSCKLSGQSINCQRAQLDVLNTNIGGISGVAYSLPSKFECYRDGCGFYQRLLEEGWSTLKIAMNKLVSINEFEYSTINIKLYNTLMLPAVKDPANACLERAAAKLIEDRVTILSICESRNKGPTKPPWCVNYLCWVRICDKTGRKFGWCLQFDFSNFRTNHYVWS